MATFALCSFANPCALGIFISTLTALCPSQRTNIITLSIRALVCSTMVTFMTACVAGDSLLASSLNVDVINLLVTHTIIYHFTSQVTVHVLQLLWHKIRYTNPQVLKLASTRSSPDVGHCFMPEAFLVLSMTVKTDHVVTVTVFRP